MITIQLINLITVSISNFLQNHSFIEEIGLLIHFTPTASACMQVRERNMKRV